MPRGARTEGELRVDASEPVGVVAK